MTRRDEFISRALAGLLANSDLVSDGTNTSLVIDIAIGTADECLEKLRQDTDPFAIPDDFGFSGENESSRIQHDREIRNVAARNERNHLSDNDLIRHAEEVLANPTWDNPDWERIVRGAIGVTGDLAATPKQRHDSRVLLASLQPEPAVALNGDG